MLAVLREDLLHYREHADRPPRSRLGLLLRVLLLPRLQAVALLRLAQGLARALPPLAVMVKGVNSVLTSSDLSHDAKVGPGLLLFHPMAVVIGPRCHIGSRCRIMQSVTLGHGRGGSPTIGDDVFIGAGAVLVGGIQVGDRASIGANSVVTFDVPPGGIVRAPASDVVKVVGR